MAKANKATGIKTWPEDDRPREKLLKKGARALSKLVDHIIIGDDNYFSFSDEGMF